MDKVKTVPLGEVCDIISGQSPPSEHYNKEGRGLPFFQGKADFGERHPVPRVWCHKPVKIANSGDILFCVRAPVGPTNVANDTCCIGRGLAAVRAGSKVNPDYLLHVLRSVEPQFAQLGNGSTFKAITRADLSTFEIPLPTLLEQKRIADILDKADALRRKRQEALRLTDDFLQSVFLDMFGDPVTNPKGWEVCTLEDLCEAIVDCPHSTPRYQTSKTEHPCVRTSDLQNGYLNWSTTKYVSSEEYLERTKRLAPRPGDVVYSREGERFGIAARIVSEVQLCLGQRMMLFRPAPMRATTAFLWLVLNSRSVYQQASNRVGGSTSPHVNVGEIKAFKVVSPPISRQQALSEVCEHLDKLRSSSLSCVDLETRLSNALSQGSFQSQPQIGT